MTNPNYAPACACGGTCPNCSVTKLYGEQDGEWNAEQEDEEEDEFGRGRGSPRPPRPRPWPRPRGRGRTSCLPGTVRGPSGTCVRPPGAVVGDFAAVGEPAPASGSQPALVAVESPGGGRIRDKARRGPTRSSA